jgi:hypothetical protein
VFFRQSGPGGTTGNDGNPCPFYSEGEIGDRLVTGKAQRVPGLSRSLGYKGFRWQRRQHNGRQAVVGIEPCQNLPAEAGKLCQVAGLSLGNGFGGTKEKIPRCKLRAWPRGEKCLRKLKFIYKDLYGCSV